MPGSEDILLKAELLLERMRETAETKEARRLRRRRRVRDILNRALRIVGAWVAVVVGAFAFSATVAPLGFWGLLIVPLLMLLVTLFLLRGPAARAEVRPNWPREDLAALGPAVEEWLDRKRSALPAPVRHEVDRILLSLDQLSPELKRLPAASPEAGEAHRLLAEHLPRLVDSYEAIPAPVRSRDREAVGQLSTGLRVIADELGRIGARLTSERLEALEVEGRFLQIRYKDQKRIGG